MKKKIVAFVLVMLVFVCMLCSCNRQIIDLTYKYNYAYIELPGGEMVEGRLVSWYDYENSDVIQVVINGVTYLTHYENVVLIAK
jgi:hypothetical protein